MSSIVDLLSGIVDFIKFLGNGLANFIDFILNLPSIFYRLVDFTPMPIQGIILAFLGFIVFIIIMKVVAHFV